MNKQSRVLLLAAFWACATTACAKGIEENEGESESQAFAATTAATTIATLQSENAATKSAGKAYPSTSNPTGWNLNVNGYIQDTVNFPLGGTHSFAVTAFGAICSNVWPSMQLSVDGQNIGASISVNSTSSKTYTVSGNVTAGSHTVRITYANDSCSSGSQNRQLILDKDVIARTSTADTTAPSVPTGLTVGTVTAFSVALSWNASTDNVGVTGYKVFRGGTQIGTATTRSYSDNTAAPSTTYSYTVAAYDAAGNTSAQSTAVGATTPASTLNCTDLPTSGVLATFVVNGESFTAWINNATGINQAIALWHKVPNSPTIPIAHLRCTPASYNCPYHWYLDPAEVKFADSTVEVCDGRPASDVEPNCPGFANGYYCPWQNTLTNLRDCRTNATCPVMP